MVAYSAIRGGLPTADDASSDGPVAPFGARELRHFSPHAGAVSDHRSQTAMIRVFTDHPTPKLGDQTYGGLLHHTVLLDLCGPTWNPPSAILFAVPGVLGSHDATSWLSRLRPRLEEVLPLLTATD